MKLIVNRDQIIDGLQKAAAIIPMKAASVSLRSIWLKAAESSLSIMATDANLEFTGMYPAQVEEPGLIGVHGRAFADLISRCPAGEIHLSIDEKTSTLSLEQGRRKYNLPVSSAEWFQEFSAWPDENAVMWSADSLADIIDHVMFCINDDDTRDAMACLFFDPRGNGKINCCGLNGHQFAMCTIVNEDIESLLGSKGLLIQKKYLNDIKKWLGNAEMELNLTEKRLFLRQYESAEMLSIPRFTHSAFPDYNLFLSRLDGEPAGKLLVSRKDCLDVMGRFMIFMSDTNRCVFMHLHPQELELSVSGNDNGSGRENMEADYKGNLERIAFPNKNLTEILGHFTSTDIEYFFTGEEEACGIKGSEDPGYLVILMPMRVVENVSYAEDD